MISRHFSPRLLAAAAFPAKDADAPNGPRAPPKPVSTAVLYLSPDQLHLTRGFFRVGCCRDFREAQASAHAHVYKNTVCLRND